MDKFAIRLTEIYYSKLRLMLVKYLTIGIGLFLVIGNLYFEITGHIPLELKVLPFVGQTFFTILLIVVIAFILLYLTINTSDKSFKGTFEINDKGVKFSLGKKSRQIPWNFIRTIETNAEEWKFETVKSTFWIEFEHNYERYRADTLIKENINGRRLIK
jgi:hypothetical protein